MPREVPIAWMFRDCMVQSLNALEDQFHRSRHPLRAEDLHHLLVQFIDGQTVIQLPQDILSVLPITVGEGSRTRVVQRLQHQSLSPILPQRHSRTESDEVADSAHVDTVEVRVTDLRSGAYDDDALRMEAVQYLDDALVQGGSPHDAIVDDN